MSRCSRHRWHFLPLVCLLLSIAAARVDAATADSPLSFIPENALAVARVKSPEAVIKSVMNWVPAQLQEEARELISQAQELCGDGVDVKADWWVVLFCEPGEELSVAYIAQTTDLEKAKKSYSTSTEQSTIGKWQVFTDSPTTTKHINECQAGKVKAIAGTMNSAARATFEKDDVSVFINAARVRAVLRDELDGLKGLSAAIIEQSHEAAKKAVDNKTANNSTTAQVESKETEAPAESALPFGITLTDPNLVDALETAWNGGMHLIEETDAITCGLTIDEKGCAIQAHLAVAPNSPTDRFFAQHAPSEMKPLDRLPAGASGYFGFCGNLTELTRWYSQLEISCYEQLAGKKLNLAEKLKPLPQGKVSGYFGSLELTPTLGEPTKSALVTEGSPAQDIREFENRMIELTNASIDVSNAPATISPATLKRNAETIGRQKVDLVITKSGEGAKQSKSDAGHAIVKVAYAANETQETRTASLPGLVLQTSGGGREAMEHLLHNYESGGGAGAQPMWKAARDRCGAKANLIGMIDIPRCASAFLNAFAFPAAVATGDKSDEAKATRKKVEALTLKLSQSVEPSYSSIAVTTEPHAARYRMYIPREQVNGLFRLYQLTMEAMATDAPAKDAKPPEKAPEKTPEKPVKAESKATTK